MCVSLRVCVCCVCVLLLSVCVFVVCRLETFLTGARPYVYRYVCVRARLCMRCVCVVVCVCVCLLCRLETFLTGARRDGQHLRPADRARQGRRRVRLLDQHAHLQVQLALRPCPLGTRCYHQGITEVLFKNVLCLIASNESPKNCSSRLKNSK